MKRPTDAIARVPPITPMKITSAGVFSHAPSLMGLSTLSASEARTQNHGDQQPPCRNPAWPTADQNGKITMTAEPICRIPSIITRQRQQSGPGNVGQF